MIRLFRISIPSSALALVLSETVLVLSCYVAAAYWTLDIATDIFLLEDGGWWRVAFVAAFVLLGLHFHDLYENYRIPSRTILLQQFCLVLGIAFLLQAVLSYGRWDIILPRRIMVWGSALVLILGPLWRILFTDTVWQAVGAQRLLFIGASPAVREIVRRLRDRPELGMTAIGFMDDEERAGEIEGMANLGALPSLTAAVAEHRPDRIVVGMLERRAALPIQQLLELRFSGVHIEDSATTYETVFHRVSTRELRPSQLVFSADLGPHPSMVTMQSVYSWLLCLVMLAIALPVMLLVALAVRLSSAGPILYRQMRTGKDGVPFLLYKFRSMYKDAEAHTGAVWATKDDPRVTPLGRWLRRLRLDELPQLFNVIRGEMSLVGPRPERPEFVRVLQEKIPYYRQRLCVRPGITGWAQINHKYGDTIEDTITKLEYDLYYIKNLAPSLDAYIVFHTVKTVLLGRGAQ
jgi:sugar transferase (PEP-CTERM system associated)